MKLVSLLLATTLAFAQNDNTVRLNKPALQNDLFYLEAGLNNNLRQASYTLREWTNNQIPSDCRDIANRENRPVTNFRVFDVTYNDCGDPWIFCYNRNSEVSIDVMARQFGKMPLQMREWVKHVVSIPNPDGGYAYNLGTNIVFFRPVTNMLRVVAHEIGHSLDLYGAFGPQLSPSDRWWNNYRQDSHVPDLYSQTNAIEDVAQGVCVALYNVQVPQRYSGVEPGWRSVERQFTVIQNVARENGVNTSILGPTPATQRCTRRIAPSQPVPKTNSRKFRREEPMDVSLKFAQPIYIPLNVTALHSADTGCSMTF